MNRAERKRVTRGHEIKGWTEHPSPKQLKQGDGWFGGFTRTYRQGNEYVVLIRPVDTPFGEAQHACMRNAAGIDIPWAEKQRIKNELFGPERTAIEVFPAESELVDAANMYHIWLLPEGCDLPFTLKE